MARSTTKSRLAGSYLGDLIRAEWHRGYNYVSAKLVNPIAGALTAFNPLGQPVKASGSNYVFVQSGDEAATIGLVASDKLANFAGSGTSGGVTLEQYLVLRRGPALVDQDALPAADVNGGALTAATIATALAALSPPIICQRELAPTKTQST